MLMFTKCCVDIRTEVARSSPLLMPTDVAPSGSREAIAGLLMRQRQQEYTQLKSFRCDSWTIHISSSKAVFVCVCVSGC